MRGKPGNAGSVCGYFRSGVRRDCYFTVSYSYKIPDGYRLDSAGGSIYEGCKASASGLSGAMSCWGFGPTGGEVNGAAMAQWWATYPGATWAIRNGGGDLAKAKCEFYNDERDTNPPNCGQITINAPSGNGWYRAGSYTATMYATDGGVGINSCHGGGNFSAGISSNGGRASVTLFPKDMFGNTRSCTAYYNFDGTAPGCSATYVNNGWTNQDVYIQGHCSDGQSGCTGQPNGWATQEDQTVIVNCKDRVGLTSRGSTRVTNIDKTPPACGNVNFPHPGAGKYVREPIPVTVDCSDVKSGCTSGNYTQMIGEWWGQIGIGDIAGNTNTCPVSYPFWDKTGPSISIKLDNDHNINSIDYQTSDEEVDVYITASDNAAGVEKVCYSLSSATTKAEQCFQGSVVPTFKLRNDGKTSITAKAYDKSLNYSNGFYYESGNATTTGRDVYFDRTKPTIALESLNYDIVANQWTKEEPTVRANTKDVLVQGGYSGMGTVETVWTLTNNPALVWGGNDVNRLYNNDQTYGENVPHLVVIRGKL